MITSKITFRICSFSPNFRFRLRSSDTNKGFKTNSLGSSSQGYGRSEGANVTTSRMFDKFVLVIKFVGMLFSSSITTSNQTDATEQQKVRKK
eukprot:5271849-Amphidinium_carterae.1